MSGLTFKVADKVADNPTVQQEQHFDKDFDTGIPITFRTLSIRFDENLAAQDNARKWNPFSRRSKYVDEDGKPVSAAESIRKINFHLHRVDDIFTKFSTSPSLGLESSAVARRKALGKNIISPPPTKYLQKGLMYVFGGFNFLMWIAFIVTVLSYQPLGGDNPAPFNLGVA
ncbi:UNVERIFIED_CONTAM: hypothetical protein HDU68_001231, partial [Siphonaria sp. JEL0065]